MARYDTPNVRYDEGWRFDSDYVPPQFRRSSKMIKPKLQLDRSSDSDLAVMANAVKDKMTENAATFPNSAGDVTALGTELADFNAKFQAAQTGKLTQSELTAAKDN